MLPGEPSPRQDAARSFRINIFATRCNPYAGLISARTRPRATLSQNEAFRKGIVTGREFLMGRRLLLSSCKYRKRLCRRHVRLDDEEEKLRVSEVKGRPTNRVPHHECRRRKVS